MATISRSISSILALLIQSGPVLVATSAIPDPQVLSIKAIYDEGVVQDGHTR